MHLIQKFAALCLITMSAHTTTAQTELPQVTLHTTMGNIVVQLDTVRAPITSANFMRYVQGGHYDHGAFYRTVRLANDNGSPKIEVIQGGMNLSIGATTPFPPIQHESTDVTGLTHTDGTISMARGAVNTAASEFFICIGAQPGLDSGAPRNADGLGFAAFGQVISGMDVVRRIHESSSDSPTAQAYVAGQIIDEPVVITRTSLSD